MTKNLRAASLMALLAIGCLLTHAPARAQSVYGSIFGTVTDTTGAVVPGATVTVTDEAKGTVEVATSNGTGEYSISHLVPDIYDLKVEAKGFTTFISKGITVQADTSPRVDASLKIASGGSETITVDADSVPLLKTDRADVSTIFDQQQVQDLPVPDQNYANLQLLLPGAQLLGWSHAADENPQASRQIQVDGQAFGGVAYELDGTDNQDPILGIIVINPALDSITEAKITTQNFDAEFGKAVAAVMTVQTKSGSNSFHGGVYDFRTSNGNEARDPFSQCAGSFSLANPCALPPGLKNKFGGNVGGPVLRDRLFFFGDYEGQRQRVGTSATNTLPSQLLTETCLGNEIGPSGIAGCDFSQYAATYGAAGTIYNNTPTGGYNPVTGTNPQFPGNVIPAALVSKQWINLLKILEPYTKKETAGVVGSNGLATNYAAGGTGLFNSDLWTVRVDDTLSKKMSEFVRFSRWTNKLTGSQMFDTNNVGAGGPGFGLGNYGGQSSSADDSLAIGADYVFSPTLVMDLRGGYMRYNIADAKNDASTEFANSIGMPGINFGTASTGGSPGFFIGSLPQGTQPLYGDGLNIDRCNCPLIEREDQFQIVNNWTKTIKNHEIKIGADLRYGRNLRVPSDSDRDGVIDFGTGPTEQILGKPGSPSGSPQGGTGLGFAAIALGDATSIGRYVSTSTNAKEFQKRIFFYTQDTWRATQKLTLNLGLRWEGYYPESVNGPGNGAELSLSDGYLHVAGIGGIPSDMGWNLDEKKQFEPRVGIAFQMNPKTVIRTGYGRSFDIGVFGSIFGHNVTQNLPVLANQSISASGVGTAFCIGSPSDNPGCTQPSGQPATGGPVPYTFPTVPASGLLPNPGYAVNSKVRPNPLQFPTLDAWNFSVQRALTQTLTLTVAYVGNKGTHTLSDGDGNNTNPNEEGIYVPGQFHYAGQTLSTVNGQTLIWDPTVPSSGTNIVNGLNTQTGHTSNALYLQRFYGARLAACSDPNYAQQTAGDPNLQSGQCGWSQGISLYGDDQNTNFNALQITLAQQTWKGLNVNFNYQYARANDHFSGYQTWNPAIAYGPDSNVRHQSATLYGSYQLPFGKGKQFYPDANKATDLLIGGYELSGTLSGASGLPFSLGLNGCGSDYPNGPSQGAPCYPEVAQGIKLHTSLSGFKPGSGWTYYNPVTLGSSGFSVPAVDQIGNAGHNNYFGPKFFNTDLSIQKTFNIWEKVSTKFRMDAYNAVNHINPGNPGGNIQNKGSITGEAPGPGPRQLSFSLAVKF